MAVVVAMSVPGGLQDCVKLPVSYNKASRLEEEVQYLTI